jgi:hypothetical protein
MNTLSGCPGTPDLDEPLTYPCLDDADFLGTPSELLQAAFDSASEELEIDEHDIEAWASAILRETFRG